jgi:hypothetical protein
MKLLIGTLLSSVSQLGGILGLALFFFLIFAILGVSLWSGRISYRCFITEFPDNITGDYILLDGYTRLCSEFSTCPAGSFCGNRYE